MRLYSFQNDSEVDSSIAKYIIAYFFSSIANLTVKVIFNVPYSLWGIVSIFFGLLVLFFMFRCYGKIYKNIESLLLKTLGIFLLIYSISFVLICLRGESLYAFFRTNIFLTFLWFIPIGVAVTAVRNMEVFYNTLLRGSFLISTVGFICLFYGGAVGSESTEYNMGWGFSMTIPSLLHLNHYFLKRDYRYLIIGIVEIIAIILFGSRGALLPIFFLLLYQGVIGIQNPISKMLFVLIGVGCVLNFNIILSFLDSISSVIGINSRTLQMVESDTIDNDSGRSSLRECAWDMIQRRPILGWGLGGEYSEIARYLGSNGGVPTGAYTPHNGVLQNLVCFGLIFGSIATFFLAYPLFCIHKIGDPYRRSIVLCFFSYTIYMYLTGSGFFISPEVAIYLFLFYCYKNQTYANTNYSG